MFLLSFVSLQFKKVRAALLYAPKATQTELQHHLHTSPKNIKQQINHSTSFTLSLLHLNMVVSLISLLLLLVISLFSSITAHIPPYTEFQKTVNHLDVVSFSGRWFQVYSSSIPRRTYEQNTRCVVVDLRIQHTFNPDTRIFGVNISVK